MIDTHAHIIPSKFIDSIRRDKKYGIDIIEKEGSEKLLFKDGPIHPLTDSFYDIGKRIEYMDSNNVAIQFLSVTPRLFFYDYPIDIAGEVARSCNDEIYNIAEEYKGRFVGVGSVPLQDVELSIKELNRLNKELGFKSIQIGSHVNHKKLADPEYFPFFEEVAKNDIVIFIHPPIVSGGQFLEGYHLSNVLGNPINTTIAAANLIFSGLFDKLPNLKICLAHGGGFLPYQIGRLEHAYKVRKEARLNIEKSPMEYFRENFYSDTVIYSETALEYLIKIFGADNVIFGTDCPYDMGDYDTESKLDSMRLDKGTKEKVLFKNAEKLL